jgi:hypothetical protein
MAETACGGDAQLQTLILELRELRLAKEEALSDLDRCRTELERTQEELRKCQAELAVLRERQQPKEEMHITKDRYACSDGG